MKKIIFITFLFLIGISFVACDKATTETTDVTTLSTTTKTGLSESEVYELLIETEKLSGMSRYSGVIVREAGDLELPTEYKGVTITYQSRNSSIISDDGVVTLPDSCWIESREQDGITEMPNLNDNWPIVLDVRMEYMGQVRTAKLILTVAPDSGFTCDKYLG